MKTLRQRYPFSAIVGQEELKQALLLNLIYPGIGGVLIRGEKGTAKSTAVRALEAILRKSTWWMGVPADATPTATRCARGVWSRKLLNPFRVRFVWSTCRSVPRKIASSVHWIWKRPSVKADGVSNRGSLRMPTGVSCMWTKSTCWMTILWTYCWMRRQWA